MPIEQTDIETFLKRSEGFPLLDVRSPSEFEHAHIPGAVSLPLFSDEERKVIGTLYKQQGREPAVDEGLDFFSKKIKSIQPAALKIFKEKDLEGNPVFYVHCWRGGMRSGAVAWLLSLYGYKVVVLKGGYKAFRNWVLQQFEKIYPFKILGGFTGTGKTEVLRELAIRGQNTIDLEHLAHHKGSAFGSLGMPAQPSSEMFENKLAIELWKNQDAASIWLEDESRHIGSNHIPLKIWEQMRRSDIYFLDIPSEQRLNFITENYGCFSIESLKECVLKIEKRLGGLETKNAIAFLNNNNVKGCFEILLRYYDKLYGHALLRRENIEPLLHKIPCEAVDKNNAALLLNDH